MGFKENYKYITKIPTVQNYLPKDTRNKITTLFS